MPHRTIAKKEAGRITRSRESGFALASTLWLLAVISAVAIGVMETEQARVRATANLLDGTKADLLADAIASRVELDMSRRIRRPGGQSPSADAPSFCALSDGSIGAFSIESETGKVDLNSASPELVATMLAGLGAGPETAQRIARAISEFEAPGPQTEASAVQESPKEGRRRYPPKHGPLETIFEADQIGDLPEDLFRRLLPLVTVHSGLRGFDPFGAPIDLLRSLAGSSGQSRLEMETSLPAAFLAARPQRYFTVHAEVVLKSGAAASSETVVEVDSDRDLTLPREVRRGDTRFSELLRQLLTRPNGLPNC